MQNPEFKPHHQKKKERERQKIPNPKKAGEVAQVVECLGSKSEALSSKPPYHQKKKKAQ
jgi:hypothetical protein